jgi:magnesium transporter
LWYNRTIEMLRVKRLADGAPAPLQGEGLWVDLENPTPDERATLASLIPINPFALEDALERGHWSRFERYPEHLFLILRTLENPDQAAPRQERVSYFVNLERQILVTFRNEHVAYIEANWSAFSGIPLLRLFHWLIDSGVNTFLSYNDNFAERMETLEEAALQGEDSRLAHQIQLARREMLGIRRLASRAREALAHLERLPELDGNAYLFRDLSDRMTRVYEGLDASREGLEAALEVYLSVQNNRLNLIVQRLTVISTLMLPMTLWAGIYGTNFEAFAEYHWSFGGWFFWGGLLAIGLGLAWVMRRMRWW